MAAAPWIVPDELWELVEPLLPRRERRFRYPGRKRLSDREALQGILFVLHTGIAWQQLPAELGFESCGCETPAKLYVYGNPPTKANSYFFEKTRGSRPICSWTGSVQVTQEDLTKHGITSDNGVYHWQLESFHGSLSEARTFTIAGGPACR